MILEQAYRSNVKVHTLKDLWSIQLDPTNRPINCVLDTYEPGNGTIGEDKWEKAYILLHALSKNGDPTVWAPTLDTFAKRLRWGIYTRLLKWGVI